jgi:hypothetical protein
MAGWLSTVAAVAAVPGAQWGRVRAMVAVQCMGLVAVAVVVEFKLAAHSGPELRVGR